MSKPVKTEAELTAMAKAELKVHADCPDAMVIGVLRSDDSREFRASADAATAATSRCRCRSATTSASDMM
jgi:hypothetical protein